MVVIGKGMDAMRQHEAEVVGEGKHLRIVRRGTWEYAERKSVSGIVAIVALTAKHELLLVEQYRPPVNSRVVELPAGLVGDEPGREKESLESAAERELLEETGYQAKELIRLFHGPPSPGISSEDITFFLARDVEKVASGGGDATEEITVRVVPLETVPDWLVGQAEAGKLVDLKVYAGLFALRDEAGQMPS
jgi:ADP-ribose pyrophosphatase